MKKKLITIFCVIFSLFLIGSVATSNNKANTEPGKEETSEVLDPAKENESKKDETPSVLPEMKEEQADKNTVNQATPSPSTNDSNNNQAPKPSTPPVVKPSSDPLPESKPQTQKHEQKQENTKQPTPTPSASPSNDDLIKQLEGEKKVETICIAATTGYPTEEAAYAAAIQEIAAYEFTHESSSGSCGAQQHFDDFGHVYWTYWVSFN